MSERRCPKCGTVYVDSARFCPRDGNMLVEVQAKAATPRPAPGPPSQGGTAVRTPPQAKPGLDRASSLLGEVLDSRYHVQQKLGEGGMSFVYLAREVSTGHDVAIKVLSPKLATDRSSVQRLRREAGLAMRLDHPKPCIILGTPEFMSPEQIRGKPLDARSDIYALGIVAFEMFTGKLPFQGRNAQEMMIARLRGQPQKLRQLRSDLSEGLESALARAMEANPDARYNTALEFADALTASHTGGFLSKIKEKLK